MKDYEVNGSGVRDPVAAAAIREADKPPENLSRAIRLMKFAADCLGFEVVGGLCCGMWRPGECGGDASGQADPVPVHRCL